MKTFSSRAFLLLAGSLCWGCRQNQGPIVAKVDGSQITVLDLQTRLQETPAAYQQYMASADGRRQFLNLMIREKVLLLEARREHLQHNEKYGEAVKQFKLKLKRELKDYQDSLLIEMVLARLRSHELAVTDSDVQHYYQEHTSDFTQPIEIQASHILVNSQTDAQKALGRLNQGEAFSTVAREMSMDPATARQGGKLTPFQRGTLVPEFEDAAFQLKNGQTSGIVKTQFGYHIIHKTGQKTLSPIPLEQARDIIRTRLQRERFDQWVTHAQSTLGVQIDEKALASVTVSLPSSQQEPPQ